MKIYDSLFILGCFLFLAIYFHTKSFDAAITIAIFIWVLALCVLIIYHFEIGDVGGYIRDVKMVKHPAGNRFFNLLILLCILFVSYAGFFIGAYLGAILLGSNGLVFGSFGAFGAILVVKVFYLFVLKRLE